MMTDEKVEAVKASMTHTAVPASKLRPGTEYPGGSINSRKYTSGEIEAMKNSIMTRGVLQSLLVVPAPGVSNGLYYVAAGNRRLQAITELLKEENLPNNYSVPVIIGTKFDGMMALDASLEENVAHIPLHPVEEYEAYSALVAKGMAHPEIAKRYGLREKDVAGALALGKLSPTIRKAWLDGEIKTESAQAFTLGKDHDHMDAIFKRLKKQGAWNLDAPQRIRKELGASDDIALSLKFVGKAAYEEAGGLIRSDLFGDKPAVSDEKLLSKLADEKLNVKCAELTALGWSWAERESDGNRNAKWGWTKIDGGANAKAEHKQKAGCIVSVSDKGTLEVLYGMLKPGVRAPKSAAEKAKATKKDPDQISNAIAQRMSEWANYAIGDTIAEAKPEIVIAALLAGVASKGDCIAITERGLSSIKSEREAYEPQDFSATFMKLQSLPLAELLRRLARVVGNAVQIQTFGWIENHLRTEADISKLCDSLPAPKINKWMEKNFDAKDYFASINKDLCLGAIMEALGGAEFEALAKKPKADIANHACLNVPKTGWLPPEMRTSHYAGPGAKKAKKAAGKKKRRG